MIGVTEIAGTIYNTSKAIADSYSVCLDENKFYSYTYDYKSKKCNNRFIDKFKRMVIGPVLLGFLMNRTDNFFYMWSSGFLIDQIDRREFEFNFLKRNNKRIVCCLHGNDIRAPLLEIEQGFRLNLDVASNYYQFIKPGMMNDSYDIKKKKIANVIDKYADIIITRPVDQASYLKRETYPFIYFYPDDRICRNTSKYRSIEKVKIVHAPSSAIIKGTQLVRAAVKKLQLDGYHFEYIELIDRSNTEVLTALEEAHIVLNQFYMFTPGVFGIEAMASYCTVLTSADETIETALPSGSNSAWMVTRYYEIYENLKKLFDNPEMMLQYAEAGHQWICSNAASSVSGKKLLSIINSHEEKEGNRE